MDYDLTIVGAGAIGCALARELAVQKPALKVCVLDAEAGPSHHPRVHVRRGSLRRLQLALPAAAGRGGPGEHDVQPSTSLKGL